MASTAKGMASTHQPLLASTWMMSSLTLHHMAQLDIQPIKQNTTQVSPPVHMMPDTQTRSCSPGPRGHKACALVPVTEQCLYLHHIQRSSRHAIHITPVQQGYVAGTAGTNLQRPPLDGDVQLSTTVQSTTLTCNPTALDRINTLQPHCICQ
jgi:hypothetical protein